MSFDTAANQADRSPVRESQTGASKRSRVWRLLGVQVLGTGAAVPDSVVTNNDLARLGYDSDWIIQRTGIRQRRRLPSDQATSDMGFLAAERCLQASGVSPDAIDLILVATMTPDRPVPSTACLLQERLGLRAAAMDLNAACAGFMYAMASAAQFVKTGAVRHALVIGADTNTRIVNPSDPKTYPLFGDGAGAVVVGGGSEQQGFLAYTLGAEGAGADLLGIPGGGSHCPLTPDNLDTGKQYIHMDGRSVFKWAVRVVSDAIQDVLIYADLSLDDIQVVILHQANMRIMEAAAEDLGIDRRRLFINLDRYGNTSAGSIPLCVDEACRSGRIRPGDKVLLCGFGAGLAWGAAIVRW